jgi:hypothetical protein
MKFRQNCFKRGGEILLCAIHKLINSVWNTEELSDQWKESIIVPVHKMGFCVTDQRLIRFSAFVRYQRNNWSTIYPSAIHRLQESLRFSEMGSIVQFSHRV